MRIENIQKHIYSFDDTKPIYTGQSTYVYTAVDESYHRNVCLKIVSYKGNPSAVNTIKNEVIGLARVNSYTTNVPVLLDFWQDDKNQMFYIVMQLITGDSLRKKMPITDTRTFLSWMISLLETVEGVHKSHICHKDIKPENIMITPNKDVYLIDFNISIAKPNLKEGTIYYKAPEMYKSGITVAREQSDIFSIGVIMYEFFAGKLPCEGIDYGDDMFAPDSREWGYFTPPCSVKPNMPKVLSDIITKCMSKNPQARYTKASELKRELINASREIRAWTK